MKYFNITGLCIPKKHYMADISKKVAQVLTMIEKEQYFTINKARQYGKTTFLFAIEQAIKMQNLLNMARQKL